MQTRIPGLQQTWGCRPQHVQEPPGPLESDVKCSSCTTRGGQLADGHKPQATGCTMALKQNGGAHRMVLGRRQGACSRLSPSLLVVGSALLPPCRWEARATRRQLGHPWEAGRPWRSPALKVTGAGWRARRTLVETAAGDCCRPQGWVPPVLERMTCSGAGSTAEPGGSFLIAGCARLLALPSRAASSSLSDHCSQQQPGSSRTTKLSHLTAGGGDCWAGVPYTAGAGVGGGP